MHGRRRNRREPRVAVGDEANPGFLSADTPAAKLTRWSKAKMSSSLDAAGIVANGQGDIKKTASDESDALAMFNRAERTVPESDRLGASDAVTPKISRSAAHPLA